MSAGVQKVLSRSKETYVPFINFLKNASFFNKSTFHQPFLVNDQKNKKWSSLFPTRTHGIFCDK